MASKNAESPNKKLYAAYKKVVTGIAEDLAEVDVRTIQYTEDLKPDPTSKHLALDLLECLEKKGKFSCHNIEPLEAILSSVNRCDLITKHVDPFKRQYSRRSAAMQVPHCGRKKRRSKRWSSPAINYGTVPEARERQAQTELVLAGLSPSTRHRRWSISGSPTDYPSLESHVNEGSDEEPVHYVYTTPTTPASRRKLSGAHAVTSEQLYSHDPDAGSQHSSFSILAPIDDSGSAASSPVTISEHSHSHPQLQSQPRIEPAEPQAGTTHPTVTPDEPRHGSASSFLASNSPLPLTSSSSTSPISSSCSTVIPHSGSCVQPPVSLAEPEHQPGKGAGDRDIERSWDVLDRSASTEGVPAGQCSASWRVKRSDVYITFCEHKEDKSLKLGKMATKLEYCNHSNSYLKFLLRLYPCGEDEDRDNDFVTLGVEMQVPPNLKNKLMRVKLSCRVVECPGTVETEPKLLGNSHAVSKVIGQCFNVYRLVSHMAIIHSRSSHLTVHATAEVEHMHSLLESSGNSQHS